MCALFGGQRDVSLFRSVNKEIIHRYIDTEVLIYTKEWYKNTVMCQLSINILGKVEYYSKINSTQKNNQWEPIKIKDI